MSIARPLQEWAQRNGLFFALVILIVFFWITSERFMTSANVAVILQQVSVDGIIAIPGAMLVLSGYVDLSVGSLAVLSAVIFGEAMQAGLGLAPSVILGLAAGTGWGAFNGYLIAYLGFSPIIVTLGGLAGARGLSQLITHGFTVFGFGPLFAELGNGTLLSVPVPVWIYAIAFIIGAHVWYQTPYGRHMAAIGGAREAARSLGIKTRVIPFWLYVASGFASAIGGLIVTSELDGASVSLGLGMELDVLTGILLGGVAFTGGRGSLFGVLFGTIFIGALSNGLIQINVSPYFQQVAVGMALVFAAGLDVLYQRLDRIRFTEEEPPAGVATAEASEQAEETA
ncbi:MAG: ABC transporter permease [Methylobacteriaceae bacterium]|nr:ABC transporter permease [Methylobacteriaceae bacterium]